VTVHSPSAEQEQLEALRRGDERAYAALVDAHASAMLRVARLYVRDRTVAEEVVQEAWLGVLRGIERFEGRSTLRTWLLRVVANIARSRAVREARSVPLSAVARDEPSVPADRFRGPDDLWSGHWASPPAEWSLPDHALLTSELRAELLTAMDALPEGQRRVISLRDVEGWSADDVCDVLELSEANQRVLLHRARSTVRRRLGDYLSER